MAARNSRITNRSSWAGSSRLESILKLVSFSLLLVLFLGAAAWVFLPRLVTLDRSYSLVYFQQNQQQLAKIYYVSFNPVLNQVSIQPLQPEFEVELYSQQQQQTQLINDWWQQLHISQKENEQKQKLSSFFSSSLKVPVSGVEEIGSDSNLEQKGVLQTRLRQDVVNRFSFGGGQGSLKLYFFARGADFVVRENISTPEDLYHLKESQTDCAAAVLNTTDWGGLANYYAQILNNGGVKVIRVASPKIGTDKLKEQYGFSDRSQILYNPEKSGCDQVSQVVNEILVNPAEIRLYSEQLDYWFNRYRADLVILLADDQNWTK